MPIRDRYQTLDIGHLSIRLRLPADLDQFDETDGQARAAGISREAFPLFGIIWASSEVLAHLMLEESVQDRRILEIGCGMGLASHVLNALGADITALDIHPVTAEYMASNTALNDTPPVPFVAASWSDPSLELGEFDLIIGADILYEPRHIRHLPDFLSRHLAPDGEIMIVDPSRGQSEDLKKAMGIKGFHKESTALDFVDHLGVPYHGNLIRWRRKNSS